MFKATRKFVVELSYKEYNALCSRAEKETLYEGDDFNPMDWSGGNFDDCYYLGKDHDGDIEAAREILSLLTNEIED
jgi:hypothetical protein